MSGPALYLARYESRNFTFEGCGLNETDALFSLESALLKHARQYALAPDWCRGWQDEASTRRLTPGARYRDREPL